MTRAKLILFGAALAIVATSAAAQQDTMPPESSAIYDVDDDRDGRIDRLLILEQSDSLA